MFLLKDTMQWRRWGSNLRPLSLESSTLPLSHCAPFSAVSFLDPIWHVIKIGWVILHFEELQVWISKWYCISFTEEWFTCIEANTADPVEIMSLWSTLSMYLSIYSLSSTYILPIFLSRICSVSAAHIQMHSRLILSWTHTLWINMQTSQRFCCSLAQIMNLEEDRPKLRPLAPLNMSA